jgi:hypothetical protein
VLFIEPLPAFQLRLISRRPTILDATPYVEVGVDVLKDVVRGLIHLFIGIAVASPDTLGAQRASILA